MTRVLQFTSPNPPASVLVQLMVLMLNNASNIARLSGEAGYGTRPFQASDFGKKHDDPNTYWIDYDATLPHLTDYGRTLMQSLIEGVGLDANGDIVPAPSGKGMLQMAPMVAGTEIKLRLVDVADLAAGGYIAPSINDSASDDPPPFVPDPAYDPDLSIRDTTPPEVEIPSVGWIFVIATLADKARMDAEAIAAGLDDGQDQTHRAGSSRQMIPRWALKKHKLSPALLSIYGDPYWQVQAPAIWGATAQWPAEVPYS